VVSSAGIGIGRAIAESIVDEAGSVAVVDQFIDIGRA
jgi:hypothetical protein